MNQKQKVREKFRSDVFTRDKNTCRCCKKTNCDLDAHHIIDRSLMPNGGYVKENGISVCDACHLIAEKFHITSGEDWEEGYHPNDLYKLINSSYELAVEESYKLN